MCEARQRHCIVPSSLQHRYQWYVHVYLSLSQYHHYPLCVCVYVYAGVVLGVVCHGGLLLTTDQLTAGQLMAFLVATQTIQRYQDLGVYKSNIIVCVCVYVFKCIYLVKNFSI